jgi:hypothetical protein
MTQEEFLTGVESNQAIVFGQDAPDADRTLEGAWLSEAADRGLRIRISNGIITGPVVLDTIEVRENFELIGCQLNLLTGRYATFKKWFRLELCSFTDHCGLRGARFSSGVWFRGSTFANGLDLGYISVAVDLDLDGIDCTNRAYLVGISTAKNLHARKSVFHGDLHMALVNVGGQCDANGSRFLGDVVFIDSKLGGLILSRARFEPTDGKAAAFDRMTVDSGANFSQAWFGVPAQFGGISVKGQLVLDEATFLNDCLIEGATANDLFCRSITCEAATSLVGSHVFSADFTGSTFKGPARFNDLRVDIAISLVSTTFCSIAIFDRITVGQSIRVTGTKDLPMQFRGEVTSFAGAVIGSQGIFEDLTFVGAAVFESSSFGADLFFERCRFEGAASFIGMRTAGNISVIDTTFLRCEFHRVSCKGNFGFAGCTVAKEADLSYLCTDGNLVFSTCNFESEVILKNSRIAAELSLKSSVLNVALSLEMVSCGALEFFQHLVESASDRTPDLSKIKVNAIGLRYGQLYCVWRDFIAGISASKLYVLDPYTQLERHLRNVGAYHWADEVYAIGRRNFRNTLSKKSLRYWWDIGLDLLSGYGLKPRRTILALLALFAVTTCLIAFVPKFAVPDPKGTCNVSQRATSPDLEIAINLAARQYAVAGDAAISGWAVSDCPLLGFWLRPYSVIGILRLIALILIPFVVASLAGVLKYVGKQD